MRARVAFLGLLVLSRRFSGLREPARIDTHHLRDKRISRLEGVFEVAIARMHAPKLVYAVPSGL